MAKRSRKRHARSEKDKAGCMWGFINMFDFRQGPTNQKLLSDRKHGVGRHVGTKFSKSKLDSLKNFEDAKEVDDVDDSRVEEVNLGMASVKTLMAEEMSRVHPPRKIPSDEVERIQSELGLQVHLEKKYKQTTTKSEMVKDLAIDPRTPACLETHQSNCTNPTDRSSLNFDLAAFMTKFYGENSMVNHRKHDHLDAPDSQLADTQFLLRKALAYVAEVFLSQNFNDTKHLNETVQSKEFMDALVILNSNKELLLDLLEDPNSILLRHIQDHQNALVGNLSQSESGRFVEASELLEETSSSGQCEKPINHKLFNKQSGYSFFRKKDKSKGAKPLKGGDTSHALNRIVVLKPISARVDNTAVTFNPSSSPQSHHSMKCQEDGERVLSHFSLKEIKRRLKYVLGESKKERHVISMDGVLHRIPYGSKDSADSGEQNARDTSQSSVISKKRDKKSKAEVCQQNIKDESSSLKVGFHQELNMAATAHPSNKESFYEEAKKHLIEMLDTKDGDDMLPTSQISKSLGRFLSLQEYNLLSPRFSPGREKGPDLSPVGQLKQEDTTGHSRLSIQDLVKTSCADSNLDNEAKEVDVNPTHVDTQIREGICAGEDLNQKGSMAEIVTTADIEFRDECAQLNVLSESDGNESGVISERCEEEVSSAQSGLGSPEEISSATPCVIPPTSLLVQNRKDNESILEMPERPSPVSVLEPFFVEDVNSPETASSMHTESPICPRSIHYEEHDNPDVALTSSDSEASPRTRVNDKAGMSGYMRTVLEVSGLNCDEISNRWLSSDPSIDPSLLDEIGTSYSQLMDDPKLLFDCVDEVLVDIRERLFSYNPWVSFVKSNVQPIPTGGSLIQEVRKGIDRRLQSQSMCTLDQIIGKDMEGGTWMDLRSETEGVVIEMADTILEVIMEETALEMWV